MSQNPSTPLNATKTQCTNNEFPMEISLKKTLSSIKNSPEMPDKLNISSGNESRDRLNPKFGNPTPVAILGLCIALTPLSIELLGWRGASGFPATNGANYFFGGLLLILSGVGEFVLGNTFPSVVFFAYGAHFLTVATTFTPSFAVISSYTTDGSQKQTPEFQASFGTVNSILENRLLTFAGFYFLFMGLLSMIFFICSFRTNAVFVMVFTGVTLGFALATAGLWNMADGNAARGQQLLEGAGGCWFVASIAAWYFLLSVMMVVVDMPFTVPVFDLSTIIKGGTEKRLYSV
ncbi:Protein alcS [Lachnellula subtilissima]|uniref:Protein alcS n=1 Tax=Lachnellula subtilissima TaxID=602034 RepID=A0A8H8RUA9_9HELO|nr:Protein alcS [Lachnellula subtilissima]